MKTVLVVTPDDALRTRILRGFAEASVFLAQADADALKTLRLIDVDTVIRDSRGPARSLGTFVSQVREMTPGTLVLAIGPGEEEGGAADLSLPATFTQRDLDGALHQADGRQRMLHEIATLRAQVAPRASDSTSTGEEPARETEMLTRILREFSRVFAAGFDLPRLLDMFLDAIGELLRPTRSALLLLDSGGQTYRVRAHRALAPQVVDAVRVSATHGLSRWLATQGRPARLQDLTDPALIAELRLLGGVVAVPLLTQGELVAMLVVGQPVVGGTYGRHETEILFDLATHLATAIRDITLHHQLQQEKEFNERILAHMSSGVITIGRDERVGTMNQRAEEILGLSAVDVIRQDLRVLPSPLGDMLYETLAYGRAQGKSEIQLALRGLWLEVSTYPIRGEGPTQLGAVLVFEDRTTQKELAAQKRQTQEFQLLGRVIARIADEIKNPLVSINTFVELIDERYDDPDFRKLFSAVVRRDVRRLVQVFEKLSALVSEGELNFLTVDVHAVVEDVVTAIELSDEGLGKCPQLDFPGDRTPQMVKVDPVQLRKALSYLVWYLAHTSPADAAKVSLSVDRHAEKDGTEEVRILISSRTATVPTDKLDRIFDPVQMVQESLIDVGPAVSQRLIEALGGQLRFRQGRHELAFHVTLPPAEA
ncbi:MAG TPA: GAF domain-containing protein [Methylomirabilota bacterium]|jgi:nitrogen-specific signal transduction histidine kinase|nr:GAF domain-containing protein [Methylomirabilota bacterium]